MGRIYDESAVPEGETFRFEVGTRQLNVDRTPHGEWLYDAGGTYVVTIRPADGAGFAVSGPETSATPADRSAFSSAVQLALTRLGL